MKPYLRPMHELMPILATWSMVCAWPKIFVFEISDSPTSLAGLSPDSFEFSGLLSYLVESDRRLPIVRPEAAISMQLVSSTGMALVGLNLP